MELADYIRVARRRWGSIVLATVLGCGVGLSASLLATPTYEARTQLFVSSQSGGSASDLLQGSSFTQQRVQSYADVVTSQLVLQPVLDELDTSLSLDDLAGMITAESPLDTVLINITVEDTSSGRSARIANAVAASFVDAISALEQPTLSGAPAVTVSTVQPAVAPDGPSSPLMLLNVILGLILGLAAGLALALLRETLDTAVRGEADVRRITEVPLLGAVTFDPDAAAHPLTVHADPRGGRSEAFRQLRTNLAFVDVAKGVRSLTVTSSVPQEGKSSTAANLALALASAGSRVVLVDGDLRRPKVAEYLGLEGGAGLTTVLIGQAKLEDVLQPWGDGGLVVLPSGMIPPNPSELLGAAGMASVLSQLEADFDMVLVDAPPLLPVTDAAILSRRTAGALVVVGSGRINRDQLTSALENLRTVDARVLGVVLNMVPSKGQDARHGYYGAYSPTEGTASPAHLGPPKARRFSHLRSRRRDEAERSA